MDGLTDHEGWERGEKRGKSNRKREESRFCGNGLCGKHTKTERSLPRTVTLAQEGGDRFTYIMDAFLICRVFELRIHMTMSEIAPSIDLCAFQRCSTTRTDLLTLNMTMCVIGMAYEVRVVAGTFLVRLYSWNEIG